MAKVTISGQKELREQLLRKIPAAAKAAIQASLEKSAEEMASTARALAPVDDGDLRSSIRTETGDLTVRVRAGGGRAWYAPLVEYGTRRMAARPFWWPAWRMMRRRIRNRIARDLNKALKDALR